MLKYLNNWLYCIIHGHDRIWVANTSTYICTYCGKNWTLKDLKEEK